MPRLGQWAVGRGARTAREQLAHGALWSLLQVSAAEESGDGQAQSEHLLWLAAHPAKVGLRDPGPCPLGLGPLH